MTHQVSLLIIEGEHEGLHKLFSDFHVESVNSIHEAVESLKIAAFDAIVTSHNLDHIRLIYQCHPHLPIIVVGNMEHSDHYAELSKLGVQQYLSLDILSPKLARNVIYYAIEKKKSELSLQFSDQMKSDFVSMVSHELRSPLSFISEGIQSVLEDTALELNTEHKDLLQLSQKGLERLNAIVNDLLDISKIEAGRLELHLTSVKMEDLVAELGETYKRICAKKGLEFKVSCDPISLSIDKQRILQVLINLLDNAIKFTDKGLISLQIKAEKERVIFSVSDTGSGISEEDLPYIFDKYRQFGKSKGTKGTGLGLAITKKLIELHGGQINVKSILFVGTVFTFTLHFDLTIT